MSNRNDDDFNFDDDLFGSDPAPETDADLGFEDDPLSDIGGLGGDDFNFDDDPDAGRTNRTFVVLAFIIILLFIAGVAAIVLFALNRGPSAIDMTSTGIARINFTQQAFLVETQTQSANNVRSTATAAVIAATTTAISNQQLTSEAAIALTQDSIDATQTSLARPTESPTPSPSPTVDFTGTAAAMLTDMPPAAMATALAQTQTQSAIDIASTQTQEAVNVASTQTQQANNVASTETQQAISVASTQTQAAAEIQAAQTKAAGEIAGTQTQVAIEIAGTRSQMSESERATSDAATLSAAQTLAAMPTATPTTTPTETATQDVTVIIVTPTSDIPVTIIGQVATATGQLTPGGLRPEDVRQTATALSQTLSPQTPLPVVTSSVGGTPVVIIPTRLPETGLFDDIGGGNSFGVLALIALGLVGVIFGARRLRK